MVPVKSDACRYMSPEYAMGGMFSEKSDAWNLWNEDKGLELVDETLGDSNSSLKVLKCMHIGLLCV
ncbi:putative non-specific serine/threonine protein kinase [Rosa chinensis]|uniref:Putative non-specific serine/threonine protein kinase n=1 Tax=Rosa chinensis TaxID=74649 RepID=A0A2P6S8B5_ROSCH|nr:putative non-specific serine/threonine protein kinase [Rosa chinensis]